MGAIVNLHGKGILEKLRVDPSEIFGRPYVGYMLFLAGSSDAAAVEWLKGHLVALDSLTGGHVLYAIFAARVRLEFSVRQPSDDEPRDLGDFSVTDIESLLRSGDLGRVANGDHMHAITYGTDMVARSFGVLRQLPCIVVLDAFSPTEIDVIRLDESTLNVFVEILRAAIHDLTTDTKFAEFVANLELLESIRQQIAGLQEAVAEQKANLASVATAGDLARIEYSRKRIDKLVRNLEAIRKQGREALNACLSSETPSFRQILRKAARERKLKTAVRRIADSAAAYTGAFLDPQNLSAIFAATGGSGG